MGYSDQLHRPAPHCNRPNCGKDHKNKNVDENNNNNTKNNNYINQNKIHEFDRNANHFDENSKPKIDRFRISERSKGVKKAKTPAQDRIQKWIEKDKSVVSESLKELVETKPRPSNLPKMNPFRTQTHVQKLNNVNVNSVESKKTLENSGSILTDMNDKVTKGIAKPLLDLSNVCPLQSLKFSAENGMQTLQATFSTNPFKKHHDIQVQSHFKINDKSKTIGVKKVKSKTPAQERLQKWADKNKTAMFESIKELVDMPCSNFDAKNHGKMIGMQKSHVTGIEPSITHVVGKTATVTNMTHSAFIIPDTNVFLHSLACIKMMIEKDLKYTVLIPHVVLQELDNLKHRRGENSFTLKHNATRAIRYIYELVQAENKRFRGQTALEDANRLINVSNNDDKILNCCLQLIGQSKEVILVTNDLNLTSIAKLNGVEAISSKACLHRFQ